MSCRGLIGPFFGADVVLPLLQLKCNELFFHHGTNPSGESLFLLNIG